jgi:predicted permease
MTLIPAVLIGACFGLKELVNLAFGLSIGNSILYFIFFAYATPLGMNTIVYPESYGGNPKTGASMALISHTLAVLIIPFTYALLNVLFGAA